jgi:hypothetical protein
VASAFAREALVTLEVARETGAAAERGSTLELSSSLALSLLLLLAFPFERFSDAAPVCAEFIVVLVASVSAMLRA